MHRLAEYETLRSTIRERGTLRMGVILGGLIGWAALLLAFNAAQLDRASTLVPFLVLAATFEISFFTHTGVERVGRYLQVFYEESEELTGWEQTVMAYGRTYPGGLDPLFVKLFAISALVNFAASFPGAARHFGWVGISLVAHLIFGWRMLTAKRLAASQRALDLERFRALKNSPGSK
jgi:hypothetical protein